MSKSTVLEKIVDGPYRRSTRCALPVVGVPVDCFIDRDANGRVKISK